MPDTAGTPPTPETARAALGDEAPDTDPLGPLRGRARILVVSAPDPWPPQDGPAQDQLDRVDVPGFIDRDMMVVHIGGADVRLIGFDPQNIERHLPGHAPMLRARFGLPESRFTALLIGKDGSAKELYEQPVDSDALFSRIDEMPMRQAELARREAEDGQ